MTLDRQRLVRDLAALEFVRRVELRDAVASTSDTLRALAESGAEAGTVVLADRQDAGRGRLGRPWHSVSGMGLYLSVLLRPAGSTHLTRWTLGAAVAACEACRELCGRPVAIEWPNDLVWGERKLGGILAEHRSWNGSAELVLGVGINVGHAPADFPGELATVATSLAAIPGARPVSREALAVRLLEHLSGVTRHLEREEWEPLAARWLALAPAARGERVRVLPGGGARRTAFEGVTDGIDAIGALRVRDAAGRVETVHLADAVRRRGVEG